MNRYLPGLNEAQDKVRNGSLEDALRVIDYLFGRENLSYGGGEEAVVEPKLTSGNARERALKI